MSYKVSLTVAALLVLCLLVVSAYAASLSSMINPNSILINQTNATMNEVRTASFSVNNLEIYNIIVNVTNSTNLTHESDSTNFMSFVFNFTNGTTVNALSSSNLTLINITMNNTNAGKIGLYSGYIDFTTCDIAGGNVQSYRLPVAVNLVNTINMTILNVTNATGSYVAEPADALTINVTPSYWNGAIIPGLDDKNFSVSILHAYNNILNNTKSTATLNVTSVVNAGTYYSLTTQALPSTLLGGNYSVIVQLANSTYTGSDTYSNTKFAIDDTALKLSVASCAGGALNVGNTTVCKFNVTNYGYKPTGIVNITYYSGTCINLNPTNSNVSSSLSSLASYVNNTTVTGAASDTCYLNATGYSLTSSDKWDTQTLSPLISFTVSVTTTVDTPAPVTTPNNFVFTPTSTHALTVTTPPAFELVQGASSVSKVVTVKNTGSSIEKAVVLSISGIDSSWYTISTGEQLFSSAQSKTYDVSFKVPETAEIGIYTITFTAKGSTASTTGTTKLTVSPSANMQTQIKANLSEYKVLYDNLLLLFNQSKAAGKNVSSVEGTINQITGMITDADSFVSSGKYVEAYQKLVQLKTLLAQAQDGLTGAAVAGTPFNLSLPQITPEIGAGIVAAIAVVGVIIYFVKKKPSKPKMPSVKKSGTGFGDKLKDRFKK